jgi:hypothetical protein
VERQNESEGERQSVAAKGLRHWAINLTFGQIFMAAREQIILNLIKVNIKIISENLDGIVFLFSRHSDFSSVRQTTDMSHGLKSIYNCHLKF